MARPVTSPCIGYFLFPASFSLSLPSCCPGITLLNSLLLHELYLRLWFPGNPPHSKKYKSTEKEILTLGNITAPAAFLLYPNCRILRIFQPEWPSFDSKPKPVSQRPFLLLSLGHTKPVAPACQFYLLRSSLTVFPLSSSYDHISSSGGRLLNGLPHSYSLLLNPPHNCSQMNMSLNHNPNHLNIWWIPINYSNGDQSLFLLKPEGSDLLKTG